jgi:protein ImuA
LNVSGIDITALRRMVTAIEGNASQASFTDETGTGCGRAGSFTLGLAEADDAFPHGLRGDALHEVFAENPGAHMAATGFALAMALRASPSRRPIIWIEEESASSEYGGLYPPGLHAFGINPSRLLIVRCPTAQDVLKAANDALEEASGKASNLISGVVASMSGQPKCLDLTASRRLLLATETAHLPVILLRSHRTGVQSAAVSRWRVAPASSRSSGANAPGKPVFSAILERNRHGTCGQWIMEWNNETLEFGTAEQNGRSRVPRPLVSVSADRPASQQHSA